MSQWGTRPSPFSSAEVTAIRALIGGGVSYTDGQLLIGSTADGLLHAATLTAGTGMTITNGNGSITLSAATAAGLTVGTSTITSGTTTRILYDNAGVLGEYTISGSGTVVAMATSPSFTTPTLGVATATSINKMAITAPATSSTLAVADGKTLTASVTMTLQGGDASVLSIAASKTATINNSITFSGTDSTTMTFPSVSATVAGLGISQTFTGVNTFTPAARTSGSASYFTVNAPADTGITTTAESIGINHVGATRTWVDGTVATQREYLFQAPTYNKTTTSATFTKAATLAVSAAPTAGTGVTITAAYAFWVQAGLAQFDGTLAVAGHVTVEGVTSTGATGTGKFVFDTAPTFTTSITLSTANIITDTTTGTKFGTATNQKIGFFNATPIVQPTGDVITGLQNLGLMASATVLATTITSRTLWGQTYDGSGNVTGSLTSVGNITGGASSMTITAGTGASRTLTFQTTTSGSTATTALTLNADQTSTFAANISGTGAWTITGGAGNMTIVAGTGNSRTLTLQTTTSGGTATNGLVIDAAQHITLEGVTSTGATGTGKFVFSIAPAVTGAATTDIWKTNNNAVTVTTNAGTCSSSFELNTFTNSSAATMAITLSTSGAVDGQKMIVRIYDFSAVAQTIGWTNTENSTVSAPLTSNGSTTLPLTVGFIYNGSTSKWRCVASA